MSHLPRQQERTDSALKKGGRGNTNFQKPGLPSSGRGGGAGPNLGAPGRNPLPSTRTNNKRTSNGVPGSGRGSGSVDNSSVGVQAGAPPSSQQAGQRGIPASRSAPPWTDNASHAVPDVANKPMPSGAPAPAPTNISAGRGSGSLPSGDGGSFPAGLGSKTGPPAATTTTPSNPSHAVPSSAHVPKHRSEGAEKNAGVGHSSRLAPPMTSANIQFGTLPMQPEPESVRYTNLRTNSAPPNLFEQMEQVQYEVTSLGNKLPAMAVAPQPQQTNSATARDPGTSFPTQTASVQPISTPVNVSSHPQPLPQQVHTQVHPHAQLPVTSQPLAGRQVHPQPVIKPSIQQPPPQIMLSGGSHSPQGLGGQPPSMANVTVGPMGHGPKFQQAHMMAAPHAGQMMGNQIPHLPPQMTGGLSGPVQTFGGGMAMHMPQQMAGGGVHLQPRKSEALKIVDPKTKKEVKVDEKDGSGVLGHPVEGPSTSGVVPAYGGPQIRGNTVAVSGAPQVPQMSYPGPQMMTHNAQFYPAVPPNGQVGLPAPQYYAQQNAVKPGMSMPNMNPQAPGQVRYHQPPPYGAAAVTFAGGGPMHANTMKIGMGVGGAGLGPGTPDVSLHGLSGVGMPQIPVGVPMRPTIPGQQLVSPVAGPTATAVGRSIAPLALPPQPLGIPQAGVGGAHTSELASPTQLPVGFSSERMPGPSPTLVPHGAAGMVAVGGDGRVVDMHRRPNDNNVYPMQGSYNYARNPNPSPRPAMNMQQQPRMGHVSKPNTPPMGQTPPAQGMGLNQAGVKMPEAPGRQPVSAMVPDQMQQAGGQAGKRHQKEKPQRQQPPPQAQRPGAATPQVWPPASDAVEGSATSPSGALDTASVAPSAASAVAVPVVVSPAYVGAPVPAEAKAAQPVAGAKVAAPGSPAAPQGARLAQPQQERAGAAARAPEGPAATGGRVLEKTSGAAGAAPAESGEYKAPAPQATAAVTPASATVTAGAWGRGPPSSITSATARPVVTAPTGPAGKEGQGLLGQVRELREQAREGLPVAKSAMPPSSFPRKDMSAVEQGRPGPQKPGAAELAPAQPGGDASAASAAPTSGSSSTGGAVVRGLGKAPAGRKDAPAPHSGPPVSGVKEKWMEVGKSEAAKGDDVALAQSGKKPAPPPGTPAGGPAQVGASGTTGVADSSVSAASAPVEAGKAAAQGPPADAAAGSCKEALTGVATSLVKDAAGIKPQQGPPTTALPSRGPTGGEQLPTSKDAGKPAPAGAPSDAKATGGGAWGTARGSSARDAKGPRPAPASAKANPSTSAAAPAAKEPVALSGVPVNVLESSSGVSAGEGGAGAVAAAKVGERKKAEVAGVSAKKDSAAVVSGPVRERGLGEAKSAAEGSAAGPVKGEAPAAAVAVAAGPAKEKSAAGEGGVKLADGSSKEPAGRQLKNVPPKKRGATAAGAATQAVGEGAVATAAAIVGPGGSAQAQGPTAPAAGACAEGGKEAEGAKAPPMTAAVAEQAPAPAAAPPVPAKGPQQAPPAKAEEAPEDKKPVAAAAVEPAKPTTGSGTTVGKGKEGKQAAKSGKKGAATPAVVEAVSGSRKDEAVPSAGEHKGQKAVTAAADVVEEKKLLPEVKDVKAPASEVSDKTPALSAAAPASVKTEPVQASPEPAVAAASAAPVTVVVAAAKGAEVAPPSGAEGAGAGAGEPGKAGGGTVAAEAGKAVEGGPDVRKLTGTGGAESEKKASGAAEQAGGGSEVASDKAVAATSAPGGDAEVATDSRKGAGEGKAAAATEGKVVLNGKKGGGSEASVVDKEVVGGEAEGEKEPREGGSPSGGTSSSSNSSSSKDVVSTSRQDVAAGAVEEVKGTAGADEGQDMKAAGAAAESEVQAAPTKGPASKKKKDWKAFDAKFDAESKNADLYNAYKAPAAEQPPKEKESAAAAAAADTAKDGETAPTATAEASPTAKDADVDNWEDAADMPTPRMGKRAASGSDSGAGAAEGSGAGGGAASGVRKYTRDFLQTLRGAGQSLPEDFQEQIREKGMQMNFLEVILGPEGMRNMAMAGPRLSSGGGPGDDDRWQRGIGGGVLGPPGFRGSPMGGRGPMMGGPGRGVMGPGGHMGYGMGGMGHPPGLMGPGGKPAGVNGVEADRWGRNPSFRSGPAPPPRMNVPTPAIHKLDEEKRFVIGAIKDEEHAKQKKVKGILNKLTPQRFDALFEQALEVGIDNPDTLAGVISQIFEKALFEPSFCEMYARFCHRLSTELPEFVVNGEKVTFKRVLLNKCQDEFMKGKAEEKSAEEEGTEEDESDPRAKAKKEEKLMKARQRTLGNIRLIGEVYKLNMLTERIMHSCILELLGEDSRATPHEEQVEALCKLMTTIGGIIDHQKARSHMDAYFSKMEALSTNEKLSTRHRFLLLDVIELRRNDWQTRRKVEGPRMINDVHRDAEQEHRNRLAVANATIQRGGSGRDRRPLDRAPSSSSMRPGPGPMPGGPGVRRGGAQDARGEEPPMVDAGRFAGPARPLQAQRPTDEGDLRLGPQGGLGRGMGARGAGPGPSGRDGMGMGGQDTRRGMPDRGMFGAGGSGRGHDSPARGRFDEPHLPGPRGGGLGDRDRSGSFGGEQPYVPDRGGGGGRMERGGASGSFGADRGGDRGGSDSRPSSRDGGRDSRVGAERPGMLGHGSSSSSSGGAVGRDVRPATPPQPRGRAAAPAATKEECIEKSRTALLEYSRDDNIKEVKLCLEEFHTNKFNPDIVASWFDLAIQKKDPQRAALTRMITHLHGATPPAITTDQVSEGLRMYLDLLDDAAVDSPLAPEQVGAMIGRLVAANVLVLPAVVKSIREAGPEPDAAGALVDAGYGLKILSKILAAVREDKGADEMTAMFRASGVDPKDLLPEDAPNREQELERFKEAHGILSPMIPLRRTLTEMISRGEGPEKVVPWLEESASGGILADPSLARMVMEVVVGSVSGTKEVAAVESQVRKYTKLLKSVLAKEKRGQAANQLQYLFALQNFAHEIDHPQGLLTSLFQYLYNEEVVEEVAFLRWKDDNEDSTPGKLKAIMSTQKFYEWLQSLEVEEEEAS